MTPSKQAVAARAADSAASRYTAPKPNYRLRPAWHRLLGWLAVVGGVAVAVANDAMLMADDLTLLPGGHSELYLLLGVAVVAGATWFLGAFDRETTVYR